MNTKTQADEIKMFGATKAQILEAYNDRLARTSEMYWMGMLSDAQQMLAHGDIEGSRQMMNQVKFLMSIEMETKMNALMSKKV